MAILHRFAPGFKLGILGGGQLGRMLIESGLHWGFPIAVLDPDAEASAKPFAHEFVQGSFKDFETVLAFGRDCTVLTIEIENVNVNALKQLVQEGVSVFPQPEVIELIQDKVKQKAFFTEAGVPTAPYKVTRGLDDLAQKAVGFLPAVHKIGQGGYDGKGVKMLHDETDLGAGFEEESVLEQKIEIKAEYAALVAGHTSGEISRLGACEMVFNRELNLLEHLISLDEKDAALKAYLFQQAEMIARRLGIVGLLAVEFLMDKSGKIWVNEMAPRPHNSGHHTIENSSISQFELHLRAVTGFGCSVIEEWSQAAIINLLGKKGFEGPADFSDLKEIENMPGVYLHFYGKAVSKPGRKMGHITLLGSDRAAIETKLDEVKSVLKEKAYL